MYNLASEFFHLFFYYLSRYVLCFFFFLGVLTQEYPSRSRRFLSYLSLLCNHQFLMEFIIVYDHIVCSFSFIYLFWPLSLPLSLHLSCLGVLSLVLLIVLLFWWCATCILPLFNIVFIQLFAFFRCHLFLILLHLCTILYWSSFTYSSDINGGVRLVGIEQLPILFTWWAIVHSVSLDN